MDYGILSTFGKSTCRGFSQQMSRSLHCCWFFAFAAASVSWLGDAATADLRTAISMSRASIALVWVA